MPSPEFRLRAAPAAVVAWRLLGALLLIDLCFMGLYAAFQLSGQVPAWVGDIRLEGSLSERFQHVKEAGLALVGFTAAVRFRQAAWLAIGLVGSYLLLDDALQLHERVGGMLVAELGLSGWRGFRGQDFGELCFFVVVGTAVVGVGGLFYRRGGVFEQQRLRLLLIPLGLLVLFGGVVDLIHYVVPNPLPGYFSWSLVEDGGEMVAVSLLLAMAVAATRADAAVPGGAVAGGGSQAGRVGAGSPRDARLRVLVVSDHLGYADGSSHGVTTYFLDVLPRLAREGVDVRPCFLRGRHPAAAKLEAAGLAPVFLGRPRWSPRPVLDLVRLIRRQKVDVVHAAGMKGTIAARLASRVTGVACVVHFHDTSPPSPVVGLLQRRLAGWSDRALACSDAVREFAMVRFGIAPQRIETLRYGVDLARVGRGEPGVRERLRRQLGLGPASRCVLVTARFYPMKGHEQLIRALPRLRQLCPGAVVLLAGEGPTREATERLAHELGVADSVRFLGYRADVPDLLAAADVLALPSLFGEGLPYSLLEAMAACRPVVASHVAGVSEIVRQEENGLLVPSGDPGALADALARVLTDPDFADALARRGRATAEACSLETHLHQLQLLYADVVRTPARSAVRRAVG
ncbi:MAG: glycosyltransferase [Phycisphaeraceae bacterium]